jgi:hypothetical protein
MYYKYESYDIEIMFNINDFIIIINNILSNNFIYDNIKKSNNFFNNNELINKFIINCLEKKNNYKLIINNKILEFIFENELNNIILSLNFYDNELLELKNRIIKLENELNYNHFIFDKNLIYPINLSNTDTICFSNVDSFNFSLLLYYSDFDEKNSYLNIIKNFNIYKKDLYILDNTNYNYNNTFINIIKYINKGISSVTNYNIKNIEFNERFKLLKNNEIIFYNIIINNDIINNLSLSINRLIVCNCDFNVTILENELNINNIYLFNCNIINILGFYKFNKYMYWWLYNCKINNDIESTKYIHISSVILKNMNLIII